MNLTIIITLFITSVVTNASMIILIDPTTRNGSFELIGGIFKATKAKHWDTSPQGDVDNWTHWSGPSNDSGTETALNHTDGLRIGFLQQGNRVHNLTGHTIAVGDLIEFSWDHVNTNVSHKGGLVFEDSGTVLFFSPGAATIIVPLTSNSQKYSGSYTVLAEDTSLIGKQLGFGLQAIRAYPQIDNVRLQVTTSVPEPSSTVLLGLGGLALILRKHR